MSPAPIASWPASADVHYSRRQRHLFRGLKLAERVGRPVWGEPPVVDGRRLNPTLHALLQIGALTGETGALADVTATRRRISRLSKIGMPTVVNVEVTDRRFPGPGGPLDVRIFRPHGSRPGASAILYLHGGGWALGSLDTHDGSCRLLAAASGATVVSLEYRLAPEHPFPAAVDDTVAAWLWMHNHADRLSIDTNRTAVMGDSAGGNLAAVLALECRSNDLPEPVAQGLIYPVVDELDGYASIESLGAGFGLDRDEMDWLAGLYVPDEDYALSPRLLPLKADDLSGVAPTLLVTAGFDPLRDQGFAYARALREAGVTVVERCYDDLVHGFFGAGLIPECATAATEVCLEMGRLMGAPALAESAPASAERVGQLGGL